MIVLDHISRNYNIGGNVLRALNDVSLTIEDGEYVAIVGPSGSGKSTLMNIIGCLDNLSSGEYLLNGQSVGKLGDDHLAAVRCKHIGFVFQNFNLLPRLTAQRNVELPLRYGGIGGRIRSEQSLAAMQSVGLADRLNHKPMELSGGQQQRVAIARAVVSRPSILLADEPTGALDSKTGVEIMALFETLRRERGITIILVTHDQHVASHAQRMIEIRDGCVEIDTASARKTT